MADQRPVSQLLLRFRFPSKLERIPFLCSGIFVAYRFTRFNRTRHVALCDSLTGLGDSHTRIYWVAKVQPFKSGRTRVLSYLEEAFEKQQEAKSVPEFGGYWQRQVRKEIEKLLTDGKMRHAANNRIRSGVLRGNIGYVENEFLTGFAPPGTHRRREIELLELELDTVLTALADCDALILDLSYNAGGFEQAALTFASRFADKRRHVMSYRAPGIPGTHVRKCFVSPAGKTQFTKPVYVVTSNPMSTNWPSELPRSRRNP